MWLDKLKIAVVQKDVELLGILLDDIPQLSSKEELDSAIVLLDQAKEIVQTLQNETAASMLQIKKNIEFLQSTSQDQTGKFDITS
ncbi:MAG: hypothetical protein FAF05_03870 [Epsilonproteobacteria bacterium]|nr:hypothetical protein [Campylobacterota bacterium]